METKKKIKIFICVGLISTSFIVFQNFTSNPLPPAPRNVPNLTNYRDQSTNRMRTRIDPRRTIADGRVTVGTNGRDKVCFKLRGPEFIDDRDNKKLLYKPVQAHSNRQYCLNAKDLHRSSLSRPLAQSGFLCSPDPASAPRACRSSDGNPKDCYDLYVGFVLAQEGGTPGQKDELWTAPITVSVERAKSSRAVISNVRVWAKNHQTKAPVQTRSNNYRGHRILEPTVSGDGKLIVLHAGDGGLSYAFAENHPCRAANWRNFKGIAKLHNDPRVQDYGIAKFPIRDPNGRVYDDEEIVRGAYPWLDHDAKNLMFTFVNGVYRENSHNQIVIDSTYVRGEFNRLKNQILDSGTIRNGLSVLGSWSKGKIVLLDSIIDSTLFGLNLDPLKSLRKQACDSNANSSQCRELIEVTTSPSLKVRAYNRHPGVFVQETATTLISSTENTWNFYDYSKPSSPMDVSWIVSNNILNDEFSFDDMVSPKVLISSSMMPTTTVSSYRFGSNNKAQFADGSGGQMPRIQNESTVVAIRGIQPPAYGTLKGGARVEPVAAGGVKGRGIYLDGEDDVIKYNVGGRATGQRFWYSSLWIHPYELTTRRLLKVFPDQTHIFVSRSFITVKKNQEEIIFQLPRELKVLSNRWTHLGFQFDNRARTITFYLNGAYMGWQRTKKPFMQMEPGELLIGKKEHWPRTLAFKGWVDEFKLIAENFNNLPEYACNQAHGSLYGVNANYSVAFSRLGVYPDDTHRYYRRYILKNKLSQFYPFKRYGCEQNTQLLDSRQVPKGRWCNGVESKFRTCMGETIHAGVHGELFSDQPRPDQTKNAFCLYCHNDDSKLDGMDITRSLSESSIDAPYDPRRQPSQAPMKMTGNLPKFFQDQVDRGDVLGATEDGEHYLDFFLLKSSK